MNVFKKIAGLSGALLLLISILSCTGREEDHLIKETSAVKIDSVQVPQSTMNVFDIQTITTYSDYKSQCEGFYGYDYIHSNDFLRNVTAYKFKTNAGCTDLAPRASKINFRPQVTGSYTFRFWNGKNSIGENLWIEKTIVVN